VPPKNKNKEEQRKTSYSFDKVYGPMHRTNTLYEESVRHIVQSSMEGYHGSVFAYGQTSTGKTYTMSGTPSEPGIVPLAVQDCFSFIQNQNHANREFLLRVSYMEIYNEMINDLLAPEKNSSAIRIFENKKEGVIVRGLREEIVTCPEDVYALLTIGEARRQTGSTNLNKQSSRSHSIFRLIIESRERKRLPRSTYINDAASDCSSDAPSDTASLLNDPTGPVRLSSLSLIDLAGSESVKATGSTGARQKEGQYINKSLMTLGHVIWKLSELSARNDDEVSAPSASSALHLHIPYRDSKLTRLLQPSLSGNAQICIIATISPMQRNMDESHNTLKFASRAKRIKQTAVVTEVLDDDKSLLQNYREEIEDLKRQLKEAKEAGATNAAPAAALAAGGPSAGSIENGMGDLTAQMKGMAMTDRTPNRIERLDMKGMDDMLVSPPLNSPSANTFATAPTVSTEQDEDTTVLVAAIKDLEHLILKASSKPSDRKKKTSKRRTKKKEKHVSDATPVTPSANLEEGQTTDEPTPVTTNKQTRIKTPPTLPSLKKHKSPTPGGVLVSGSFFTSSEGTVEVIIAESDDDCDGGDDSSVENEPNPDILSPIQKKELHTTSFAGAEAADENEKEKSPAVPPNDVADPVKKMVVIEEEDSDKPHDAILATTPLPQSLLEEEDEDYHGNTTDCNTEDEEHNSSLIVELHRIQGLLGSVLEKKTGMPSSIRKGTGPDSSLPGTPVINGVVGMNVRNMFKTPQRDVEVEQLRSQLQAQELATSLRKADSSFLESQLAQKDSLLKEISKILESVETRQVELEQENAKMKMQLIRASKALRKRDAELASLRKQVALNDEDMLTNLIS